MRKLVRGATNTGFVAVCKVAVRLCTVSVAAQSWYFRSPPLPDSSGKPRAGESRIGNAGSGAGTKRADMTELRHLSEFRRPSLMKQ